MGVFERYHCIRITSAEPEVILSSLLELDMEILDVKWTDALTVDISIPDSQVERVERYLQKKGITHHRIQKSGMLWNILSIWKRPFLLFGVMLYFLLSCYLPGRIYFVEVEGSTQIPQRYILEIAADCGIQFGAKAAHVRSEDVKNQLLYRMPELQWVGVTTKGCVVTIHVKQRSDRDDAEQEISSVANIIAAKDGIISQITTYSGSPLVQTGQAVTAGEVLISGYTDCGRVIKAEEARGEVYAYTTRIVNVVTPSQDMVRDRITGEHTCYRLRIGKKVINFCNHSGILGVTCDKMYLEDYWTLPGNFPLPVSLIKVISTEYDTQSELRDTQTYEWLSEYARKYLLSQTVAGQILEEYLSLDMCAEFCELTGIYACHEMIGQVKHEEIIDQYAENN